MTARVLQFAPHSLADLSLGDLMDLADKVGKVTLKPAWRITGYRCEVLLAEPYARGHFLDFKGEATTREGAIIKALREASLWVDATRGREQF